MVRQVHRSEGPFEDFKKLFAFNEEELSGALELTRRIYPGFSEDELAQSGERVHAMFF